MRKLLLSLLTLVLAAIAPAKSAEPFEIKDGDRVLFLGDTLLEREGTYGYLETRMVEQFPDRKFTVRNLAFSADTPLGWSRASFDPAAKGFERLKEQLALVKPTVVFLGYGMAASLQEMTDRSQDWTLNRDPARYGAEPMSAARFKKELAQCMDAIELTAKEQSSEEGKTSAPASPASPSPLRSFAVKNSPVRFVLLSPIRHEDLRATRPGLPDPTEHNKLLEQYTKAIEELAKDREARLVSLFFPSVDGMKPVLHPDRASANLWLTDNGIHMSEEGYLTFANFVGNNLGWNRVRLAMLADGVPNLRLGPGEVEEIQKRARQVEALRAAIIAKNALFFHRWRPANETYLFGFRKREQGQNAVEIPKFDPLIEAAEAEIDRLKKDPSAKPASVATAPQPAHFVSQPHPTFTLADGLEISLWAENPLLAKPTQINWDAQGRLWVASSAMYPQIAPGQAPTDKIIIIEDPDHTGKATKSTVFADGLLIPTGVAPVLVGRMDTKAWVGDARPLKAAISGNVARPGPQYFTATSPLKLSDAVRTATAFPSADLRTVRVSRHGKDGYYEVEKGVKGGRDDSDLLLQDGDRVFVSAVGDPAPPLTQHNKLPTLPPPPPQTTRPASPSAGYEGRYGCYVGQSTELLYFEDTDGDGKADKKRIVFSGFGTEDTHHIVHTLRWGPDGRLYFSQSVYIHTHMETPWGVVRVNSGGVFAYDPRTERVEVVEKGLWNTWGHAWDKWGQAFYTDGAGSTGLSWGFPGATFAPNEGARRTMASISPGSYPKFAGLEIIYSPHFPADWQGTAVTNDFRAHKVVHFKINDLGGEEKTAKQQSGEGEKKSAPASPASPASSSPLRSFAVKSGYVTEQLPVLVQTSDATFRPIDVKLGPDGALYIADWSNPIINHGEVDFRDPRRDHEHGRIWRLSMKGGAAVKWESLVGKKVVELFSKVTALRASEAPSISVPGGATPKPPASPNLWEVESARQVLLRSPLKEVLAEMEAIARTGIGSDPAVRSTASEIMLALGMNQGSLAPQSEVTAEQFVMVANGMAKLLPPSGSAHFLRYFAAFTEQAMTETDSNAREKWARYRLAFLSAFAKSEVPRVRVEAMRTLARTANLESASLILDAAINAPKDDPQYEFAAWLSINDLAEVWTKAVLAGEWKPEGREKQFEFALNAIEPRLAGQVLSQFVSTGRAPLDGSGPWIELIGNTGGPGELRPLLDALLAATTPDGDNMKPLADAKHKFKTPDANRRAAAALVSAARRGAKPAGAMPPWQLYMYAPDDALPDVLRLAGLWKQDYPSAIIGTIDGPTPAPVLNAAFEALRTLATPAAADYLTAFLDPSTEKKIDNALLRGSLRNVDADKRRRALVALAPLRPNDAMKHLGTVLAEVGEPGHLQLWRDLFASQPFVQRFSQATPKDLPPAAYASAMRAAREMGRKGDGLANKLAPLAGESTQQVAPADYNEIAARAKQNGDPVAGEAMYRRMASACTTCHAIGGAGGKLGPDMTSIGASAPPDYIIESILNPAAKVKEGYHAFSFAMKDGTEAIGIPTRDTAQEQFIRTLAGEQGLPKANIVSKKIAEGGASLMPVGLTTAWSDRERLNLYAFLMELGRPGPFDASKNNVARVWMLTDSGKVDGALNPPQPAIVAGGLLSFPVYTLVDGRLTKDLLTERLAMLASKKDAVHLTARFQAASAGKAELNLTGIRKAWLDGQPLAIASEPSPSVDLTAGEHTFTVEVDAKSPPDVLRLESPAANFLGD